MAILHDSIPQPLAFPPPRVKRRAVRRHHAERLKRTRSNRFTSYGWPRDYLATIHARLDDVWGPRQCSCEMCQPSAQPGWRERERREWQRLENLNRESA